MYHTHSRHQLVSPMLASLARIGLTPSASYDHRLAALNMIDLIIGWERYNTLRGKLEFPQNYDPSDGSDTTVSMNTDEYTQSSINQPPLHRPNTPNPLPTSNPSTNSSTNTTAPMLSQSHIQLLLNFLIRFALFAIESKESQIQKLLIRTLNILKKFLKIFSLNGVKVTYMDKFLVVKSNTNLPTGTTSNSTSLAGGSNTVPPSEQAVQTYLDICIISFDQLQYNSNTTNTTAHNSNININSIGKKTTEENYTSLLFQCLTQGYAQLINIIYTYEYNYKIHMLFKQLVILIITHYSPYTHPIPYELLNINFYSKLKSILDLNLKLPDTTQNNNNNNNSNSNTLNQSYTTNTNTNNSIEIKNLLYTLHILYDIIRIEPQWIQNHTSNLFKVLQLVSTEHLHKSTKSSSRTSDAAISIVHTHDYGTDWSTIPLQLLPSTYILSEYLNIYHTLNYTRTYGNIYLRSFSVPEYCTILCMLLGVLGQGIYGKYISYIQERYIVLIVQLLENSDCPLILNMLTKLLSSWVLDTSGSNGGGHNYDPSLAITTSTTSTTNSKNNGNNNSSSSNTGGINSSTNYTNNSISSSGGGSPLSDEEQYIIYSKMNRLIDRDLREKSNIIDNYMYPFVYRCINLTHRMYTYTHNTKTANAFMNRYYIYKHITNYIIISPSILMLPYTNKHIYEDGFSAFFEDTTPIDNMNINNTTIDLSKIYNMSIYDKLIRFFTIDWSYISNRYYITMLPSILISHYIHSSGGTEPENVDFWRSCNRLITLVPNLSEIICKHVFIQLRPKLSNIQQYTLITTIYNFILKWRSKKFLYIPEYSVSHEDMYSNNIPQYIFNILSYIPYTILQFPIDILSTLFTSYNMVPMLLEVLDTIIHTPLPVPGDFLGMAAEPENNARILADFKKRALDVYISLLDILHENKQIISILRMYNNDGNDNMTKIGLSYELYDKYEEAQGVYHRAIKYICDQNKSGSVPATSAAVTHATSAAAGGTGDLKLWENRWVECSRELSQVSYL